LPSLGNAQPSGRCQVEDLRFRLYDWEKISTGSAASGIASIAVPDRFPCREFFGTYPTDAAALSTIARALSMHVEFQIAAPAIAALPKFAPEMGREHERPHPSIGRDAQPRVT
jgi:hypothetical protein